ncbi:MAG: MFS transporter, partial [Acidimicrobiales bacterium]|nr:MFS transporter [Acidimicrobiales bacterium]
MDASPQPRSWLTRNLVVLSVVSFLQDSASELLYPVLPIFLTVTLGAPIAVVGSVEAIAEGVAAATKYGAGRLSDRFPPRRLVVLGYGLAAVGKAFIAIASAWPVVLFGRGVDRLGKGIRGTPRDVLLVDDIPDDARGRAFGFHRAADTAGAVVGPLLGLALYEAFDHRIRPLLYVALIPAVLSVLAVFAARDRKRNVEPAFHAASVEASKAPLPDATKRVILVVAAFSLVNFPDALLILRAKELGLSLSSVILAYCLYNVSYAGLSYPAGVLADRLSPNQVFAIGLGCFAVAYFGLGLATTSAWVWPLFVVYGGFQAATDGVGKAWISRLTPKSQQGRAQGTFQGATGAAVLVASLWAGFAWGGTGRVPLLISGFVGAIAAVVSLSALPSPRNAA